MRSILIAAAAGVPLLLGACNQRSAVSYGDPNSIIVVMPDSLWTEVGDTMHTMLEPPIFTVRDERTFDLTQVDPRHEDWLTLRMFRQVLVIGHPGDAWMEPVLSERDEPLPAPPALVEVPQVWARSQVVTALVLPEGAGEADIQAMLPELHAHFDRRFRAYAQRRMFVSGPDEALRDTLRRRAGFGLLVPQVYRWRTENDSTYVFRNDNTTAGSLIRSILVTWRTGAADTLTASRLLAWRDSVARSVYVGEQTTQRDRIEARPLEGFGARALEAQGVWSRRVDGIPMAGPFVTRAVVCPAQDRTYLLDGWLYAPSKKKYEYMLQLETILDSFECGA